jgi:hypothetical protein
MQGMTISRLLGAMVAVACSASCGTGAEAAAPAAVGGSWIFSESYADPINSVSCQDNGVMVFVQAGKTFTGDYVQTGACVDVFGPTDNSGPFTVTSGAVNGASLSFLSPGGVPCTYKGTATGTPPTSLAGTVTCEGTVLLTHYKLTGTWMAQTLPGGGSPGGPVSVSIATTGTNLPSFLIQADVRTPLGLITFLDVDPNGTALSLPLMPGDYRVALELPSNCTVVGPGLVTVTVPASADAAFSVTCT